VAEAAWKRDVSNEVRSPSGGCRRRCSGRLVERRAATSRVVGHRGYDSKGSDDTDVMGFAAIRWTPPAMRARRETVRTELFD
jgi:hypothetical protein